MIASVLTAGNPFAATSAYASGKSEAALTAGQNEPGQSAAVLTESAVQAGNEAQTDNNSDTPRENVSDTKNPALSRNTPDSAETAPGQSAFDDELTPDEEAEVRELKQRDAEVRQHEQAHSTVGGPYAGSPQYTYTSGPDGKRYATSGEVPIDASPIRDNPEATIQKMDVVIRAALAPADPSPQDQQVAAQARQNRLQAQTQLQQQRSEELSGNERGGTSAAAVSNAVQAYQQNRIDPGNRTGESIQAQRVAITV